MNDSIVSSCNSLFFWLLSPLQKLAACYVEAKEFADVGRMSPVAIHHIITWNFFTVFA